MKDIEKLSSGDYSEPFNFLAFVKANKFPIIITIGFFLSTFYVAFFHHIIWTQPDGIHYLNYGRAILEGNGKEPKFYDWLDWGACFICKSRISVS